MMSTPDPSLTTVPNVPLAQVGEDWHTMAGDFTFTESDLRAAVDAVEDPAVKKPRMKLGHLDPRFTPDGPEGIFDGTPALGKFINLRFDDQTLWGDATGVPAWLAEVMPTAWPNRSIEGYWDVTTATGKKHPFVVTAVSLLGVELPAVETLEDLPVLFSEDGPDGVKIVVDGKRVAARRKGVNMPDVAASVATEDIRRAFFDEVAVDDRLWWWIHAVYYDPPIIIADDEQGGFWAVPFKAKGDEITFKDPVEASIQFVEKDGGGVIAGRAFRGQAAVVYASADDSRTTASKEAIIMAGIDLSKLREKLGLPDDATEDDINAALAAETPETPKPDEGEQPAEGDEQGGDEGDEQPAPEGEPTPGTETSEPEQVAASNGNGSVVTVDKDEWDRTKSAIARFEANEKKTAEADRNRAIAAAVKAGKFPKARAQHYRDLWDSDPQGTADIIANLEPGLIPVSEAGGVGDDDEVMAAQGTGWFNHDKGKKEA